MSSLLNHCARVIAPPCCLLLAACGFVADEAGHSSRMSGDVTVNTAIRYQTVRGWEVHEQSAHEHPSFPLFKDELFDRAVAELGITRVRLEMWSGTEEDADYYSQWLSGQLDDRGWRCKRFSTTNDNDDPTVIDWSGFHFTKIDKAVRDVVLPLRERLTARGEELHVNLMYDAFTFQICGDDEYHHDDDPREFAEFVLAHFIHLRDEFGLVPQSFELLLEPENTVWWTKGDALGAALVATMEVLHANDFRPRVIAPSLSGARNTRDFLRDMGTTPGALDVIDELSYHRYDRPSTSVLRGIRAKATELGAETSMLEWIGADQHTLRHDLVEGGVSAWQQFALAFQQGGGPPYRDDGSVYYFIDVEDPIRPLVVMSPRARFLSQYFRYVRPGWTRVDAASSRRRVEPVAFVSPDGRVAVVANVTTAETFTVGGLPSGTYDVTYTTEEDFHRDGGTFTIAEGEPLPVAMPATGVVTILARGDR